MAAGTVSQWMENIQSMATFLTGAPAASRNAFTVFNQTFTAVIASGLTGDQAVGAYSELVCAFNVTAMTGTGPTIQFIISMKDPAGVYYPIWTSSVLSATGQVMVSIGSGFSIQQSFGKTVKIDYTVAGTTPSINFSATIVGK